MKLQSENELKFFAKKKKSISKKYINKVKRTKNNKNPHRSFYSVTNMGYAKPMALILFGLLIFVPMISFYESEGTVVVKSTKIRR